MNERGQQIHDHLSDMNNLFDFKDIEDKEMTGEDMTLIEKALWNFFITNMMYKYPEHFEQLKKFKLKLLPEEPEW